jgi:tetratricopeptide (TPR) repeat protein
MSKLIFGLAMTAAMLLAQGAQPSEEEIKELTAIQQKQIATVADADARMAAIDAFVAKYPASPLRGYALTMAGEAAQMKRDSTRARFYYERAIQADPTSDYAMIMLGAEIAQNTGEHDLDKKEKLARAEKLARDAMELINKRVKQPNESQADFEASAKADTGRAHMTLGLVAMADQRNEEAGREFLLAAEADAMNLLRAGMAFNNARKFDEANKALDQFLGLPGLPDQFKQMAQEEKKRGQQLKNQKQ